MPKDRFFFMHIPKTAGRYMWSLISANFFNKDKVGFWAPFDRQGLLATPNPNELDVISGHISYNIDSLFTDNRPLLKLVLLRDPIERTVSQYHWVVKNHPELNLSLDEFIENPGCSMLVDNVQTRMIGTGLQIKQIGSISLPREAIIDNSVGRFLSASIITDADDDLLDRAIRRLDTCIFGITEMLSKSAELFAERTGLTLRAIEIDYGHRKYRESLSQSMLGIIEDKNKLDSILYKEAVSRFEKSSDL